MLRFASILIAVYMLAHALLPVLPAYVCTDGGRSLNPCSPTDLHAASAQDELHLADCCKLTAPAAIDARPLLSNTATVSAAHVVALLPSVLLAAAAAAPCGVLIISPTEILFCADLRSYCAPSCVSESLCPGFAESNSRRRSARFLTRTFQGPRPSRLRCLKGVVSMRKLALYVSHREIRVISLLALFSLVCSAPAVTQATTNYTACADPSDRHQPGPQYRRGPACGSPAKQGVSARQGGGCLGLSRRCQTRLGRNRARPLLQANQGNLIIVHFRNELPVATTIHWHGLRLPGESGRHSDFADRDSGGRDV